MESLRQIVRFVLRPRVQLCATEMGLLCFVSFKQIVLCYTILAHYTVLCFAIRQRRSTLGCFPMLATACAKHLHEGPCGIQDADGQGEAGGG